MRRRPGIAGLQSAAAARDQYRLVGEHVAKVRTDLMKEQLATFRSQLEDFARKHKSDIKKNPIFRAQFHEMCAKVGVDPLASNKGVWAELLGIGDFYYELGVQIVEICIATRSENGGLINLEELRTRLCKRRRCSRESLSEDDCFRAISKLKIGFAISSVKLLERIYQRKAPAGPKKIYHTEALPHWRQFGEAFWIRLVLGSGFEVIAIGRKKLVRSVPTELNRDHNDILELAQAQGYVTVDQLEQTLSWTSGRATDALQALLKILYNEVEFLLSGDTLSGDSHHQLQILASGSILYL